MLRFTNSSVSRPPELGALRGFTARLGARLRVCREGDLSALEWMGLYTGHRDVIHQTFARQQAGEALMLLGVANDFPVAQVWLDLAGRGSTECPWLWAFRVFPPLQRLGIGSWILGAAEQVARARGARQIELGAEPGNARAVRVYERLGYRAIGPRIELARRGPDGRPLATSVELVIMRRNLPAR